MKRLCIFLVVAVAILAVVALLFPQLRALVGIAGMALGGGGMGVIAKARAAGKAAEERERKRLEGMTDAQVVDEAVERDPALGSALDRIRAKYKW